MHCSSMRPRMSAPVEPSAPVVPRWERHPTTLKLASFPMWQHPGQAPIQFGPTKLIGETQIFECMAALQQERPPGIIPLIRRVRANETVTVTTDGHFDTVLANLYSRFKRRGDRGGSSRGPFRVGFVFSQWAVPQRVVGRGSAHRKSGRKCECEAGCAAKGRTA